MHYGIVRKAFQENYNQILGLKPITSHLYNFIFLGLRSFSVTEKELDDFKGFLVLKSPIKK